MSQAAAPIARTGASRTSLRRDIYGSRMSGSPLTSSPAITSACCRWRVSDRPDSTCSRHEPNPSSIVPRRRRAAIEVQRGGGSAVPLRRAVPQRCGGARLGTLRGSSRSHAPRPAHARYLAGPCASAGGPRFFPI